MLYASVYTDMYQVDTRVMCNSALEYLFCRLHVSPSVVRAFHNFCRLRRLLRLQDVSPCPTFRQEGKTTSPATELLPNRLLQNLLLLFYLLSRNPFRTATKLLEIRV